jgi:hypothetical protein
MKKTKVRLKDVLDNNTKNDFWHHIQSNPEYNAYKQKIEQILKDKRNEQKN